MDDLENILKPDVYWNVKNGYMLPIGSNSMKILGMKLKNDIDFFEKLYNSLKVGIHWNTEVYSKKSTKTNICQIYCSALPVSYVYNTNQNDWTEFAELILHASYECTIIASILLSKK